MESAEAAPEASRSQSDETSHSKERGDEDPASKKAAIRKRTKTGCLTCRKRRIKCDEARPTCANCIKSKRQCEGYNQRVIFKDPLGAFSPFGPLVYPQPSPQALVREQQLSAAQQKSASQTLPIIAPKPPPPGYIPGAVASYSPPFHGEGAHGPSPPLDYDPNLFGVPPASTSSKFTFFPPETVDGYSQSQWKQIQQPEEPQLDLNHLPPQAAVEFLSDGPATQPDHDQAFEVVKGKAPEGGNVQLHPEPEPRQWVSSLYDDDAEMGDSDDDDNGVLAKTREVELGLIVSQRLQDRYDATGLQPRTFAYHSDHTLATYEPGPANSPLNDKQIASVFWHFVNVTAPSISMYERHPFDGTSYFHGPQVKSRQHIWTSRNVGRPSKKTQPSNLAAILLLAFYEVWNSDHGKWCKHLLGGRWIIKDIPFPEMTRSMMDIKRRLRKKKEEAILQQQQQQRQQMQFDDFGPMSAFGVYDHLEPQPDPLQGERDPLYSDWDCIDVSLLNTITGRHITYDELGLVPKEHSAYPRVRGEVTDKDIDTYETMSDLYWWYCKQDVYQSILGGTKLFLEYDRWTQCPPRAPMGRSDAIYGTYDHLILLLGRLSNFQARDLSRKRRVLRAKGTFGPNGAPPGTFPGMMPASNRVPMPRGFSPPRDEGSSPQSDSSEEQELETLTAAAHREWEGINIAFEAFKNHLGPDFEPLDQDLHPMSMSPFGPALRYRTYSIAGIWMNYLMGKIILRRCHPELPPVAMMAAPMTARETMPHALELARIAHGLEEHLSIIQEVSTFISAALIESAFCLFVAGVQFQAPPQRHWLVQHLHDITRLTGWESARQIADGCESAWSRAADRGHGPAYTRVGGELAKRPSVSADHHKKPAVWGNPRRIDQRIQEVGGEDGHGKLVLAREEKAHYALGIIGVQEDLERLDLESADPEDEGAKR
ncbi:hypothetical protein JX266_001801 [Neoarthrinium moseri]|nr:hypothetical protein JX266_001801 [Neoarthrinium moseri]